MQELSWLVSSCSSCMKRWFGKKPGHSKQWYCRKTTVMAATVIGDKNALIVARGCKDWTDKILFKGEMINVTL